MHKNKLIRSYAKTYQKLPFELKLPFALFLYFLIFLITCGNFVLYIVYRGNQSITYLSRVFAKLSTKLPAKQQTIWPLFLKKRKEKKKKLTVIFPLPFSLKLKYIFTGGVFSFIFLFLPLLSLIFLQDLPNPKELSLKQIPQTTKIYDRNDKLLYEIYANQNRTLISLSDVPKHLQQATLAIEDKNFYNHPGFDIPSIIRAFRENMSGRSFQGGSTLTQQLIKSSLLTSERSIIRKVKEIILAFWAERLYTKNQILEMYFNQVPYGGTAWGVEAASEVYFDKHVRQLTLSESTFLAGITSAPTLYSPYGPNPTLWKKRQKEVLKRMVVLGYISKKEADTAAAEQLSFKQPDIPLYAPHFVMYLKEQLVKKHGLAAVEKGGLTVKTTLDLEIQEMAQQVVHDEVLKNNYLNLTNGAVVVTNPSNGDILAMVGSYDFSDPISGKVNVTTSLRQPGSTVKAITYSAALSNGFTAASILDDSRASYAVPGGPTYAPVNYDGHYFGKVSLRFALANSLNTTAVKTLNQIGVPTMVQLGQKMGIKHWETNNNYGLSVTLGGAEATMLDMATVFGTLANKGTRTDLNPVLTISDYKGTILEKKTPLQESVLNPGIAFIISDILADSQTRSAAFGRNSLLTIPGHYVSVKTGTTDYKRDNWTIGYTPDYVVTVWVGNNDNSPMSQTLASGITGAAPIWHQIMKTLLTNHPKITPTVPSDVTKRMCLGKPEYFLIGTENLSHCSPSPRFSTTIQ